MSLSRKQGTCTRIPACAKTCPRHYSVWCESNLGQVMSARRNHDLFNKKDTQNRVCVCPSLRRLAFFWTVGPRWFSVVLNLDGAERSWTLGRLTLGRAVCTCDRYLLDQHNLSACRKSGSGRHVPAPRRRDVEQLTRHPRKGHQPKDWRQVAFTERGHQPKNWWAPTRRLVSDRYLREKKTLSSQFNRFHTMRRQLFEKGDLAPRGLASLQSG